MGFRFDANSRLDRSMRWLIADAALAGLLVWITVVSVRSDAYVDQNGPIEGLEWILALSPAALVTIRRLAPIGSLVVVTVLYVAIAATLGDTNAPLAAPFFAYAVGISRPPAFSGILVVISASALSMATLAGQGDADPLTAIVWFLLLGSGWLVAISIRRNQDRAQNLTRSVVELEARHDEIAAAARATERARIAHELHDAVGHAINVMVLQAGAARLANNPSGALETLAHIEDLGRNALIDLDHLLDLLHDTGGPASRSPNRTVDDIVTLVDELAAAGADIDLHNHCSCQLDWRTGVAAHRIAQEALTNALKHAPGAHIELTMSCTPDEFHLVITDDGPGKKVDRPSHNGRGIPGMAERARLLGGHLTAGAGLERGFTVEARLPKAPTPNDPATRRSSEAAIS